MSPAQLQEWVEQQGKQTKQALERSTRSKEHADQLGERINQIQDRLGEKGMAVDRMKWRVKARFRYAHTGVEGAHQEAHKAERRLAQRHAKLNENFSPRNVERLTEAAETVAVKSEAYLQAVQETLNLWIELERQMDD